MFLISQQTMTCKRYGLLLQERIFKSRARYWLGLSLASQENRKELVEINTQYENLRNQRFLLHELKPIISY